MLGINGEAPVTHTTDPQHRLGVTPAWRNTAAGPGPGQCSPTNASPSRLTINEVPLATQPFCLLSGDRQRAVESTKLAAEAVSAVDGQRRQ